MNMLSEDRSDCVYCNPHKWSPGKVERACLFHLEQIGRAFQLETSARALLKQAWNVDPGQPALAPSMGQMGVKPDPSLPSLEVDDPDDRGILPLQSRKELDEAS